MADETPTPDAEAPEADQTGDAPVERIVPDDDWQTKARKHESALKKERRQREELERKLKAREDADKSEHEKALQNAREEARKEAFAEAEQERRKDRLELAVTRHAAQAFADVDDALLHVQRDLAAGEIDPEDIFDADGRVETGPLQSALNDLLERKPHLKATGARPLGDPDAGKGLASEPDTDPRAAHQSFIAGLLGGAR